MANSTMVGLGLTMEGIHQNEVIYEFMMENAYRPKPTDVSTWYEALVCCMSDFALAAAKHTCHILFFSFFFNTQFKCKYNL